MGAVIVYLLFHFAVGSVVCFFGRRLYFPVIMTELFLISLLVALDQLGTGARGFLTGAAVGILLALLARFLYLSLIHISLMRMTLRATNSASSS